MPIIWQLSALHLTQNRSLISGVILKNSPSNFTKNTSQFRNLLKVIKSYFINSYAHKSILVKSNGSVYKATTDKKGRFKLITKSHHEGKVLVYNDIHEDPFILEQTYPITFKTTNCPVALISDIDDTIIVSNTASFIKRVLTTVFMPPQKRKIIPFTQNMLHTFKSISANIYYVSKSESNLFNVITAFIQHNKLPEGLLFLTPFLKFYQLINPKKDFNFKLEHINFIIKNTENKKYVLLGDDSQRDMAIYAETVAAFPDSILKIYIRQTQHIVLPKQKQMMGKLLKLKIPITYFKSDDYFDVENELKEFNL